MDNRKIKSMHGKIISEALFAWDNKRSLLFSTAEDINQFLKKKINFKYEVINFDLYEIISFKRDSVLSFGVRFIDEHNKKKVLRFVNTGTQTEIN